MDSTDTEMQHTDDVETITTENEQLRAMNTTHNDEISKATSVDLITYIKTRTIRRRKKYDVPLKERKKSKIIANGRNMM